MASTGPATVELRLIGPRQVSHALAAAALAWAMEIDVERRGRRARSGRQRRRAAWRPSTRVRTSTFGSTRPQTAAALARPSRPSRAVSAGRVHCVLGAEGNQDRPARRALAEAAEFGADRVILTLGNPRTLDPDQILDDLLGGFRRPGEVRVEPDRRRAIEAALADARPGDAVLIAGKGRNAYQIFADRVDPL